MCREAHVYLHAWQVTDNEFFQTIAEEILDYVIREMLDPAEGSYRTQDADSEGLQAKFFVWTNGLMLAAFAEAARILDRDDH